MHKPDKHRRDPDPNINDLVFYHKHKDSATQKIQSEIG